MVRHRTKAQLLRDEALDTVAANSGPFMRQFIDRLADLCDTRAGHTVTGEGLRNIMTASGLPKPGHPNAWGAAIMTAKKRGMLRQTGRYLPMVNDKSHARRTPEYRLEPPK